MARFNLRLCSLHFEFCHILFLLFSWNLIASELPSFILGMKTQCSSSQGRLETLLFENSHIKKEKGN